MPPARIITVTLNPAIDCLIEVDRFVRHSHQRGRELSRTPGGKGVNVSRVLAALGAPSVATGFLGVANRSEFAPLFAGGLVADEFVTVPAATRQNITIAERRGGETHIRTEGPPVARDDLRRLGTRLAGLSRPGAIVVFSGSLPPGMSGPDLRALACRCRQAGAVVAIDTGGPALAAAMHEAWLLKPNIDELRDVSGRELRSLRSLAAVAKTVTRWLGVLLVSRGRLGACVFTRDEAWNASAAIRPSRVRNTVGCGDVLLGAFLASLARGRTARSALRCAVAAATAAACHPVTARFDRSLARRLERRIALRRLRYP